MMEKKYQLVAWTKNSSDKENARLHVTPAVELELLEPLITEARECHRLKAEADGHISPELARRFARLYEQSARLDILTGHIDYAIRFLLQAASYCDADLGSYCSFCEEAVCLAGKYGFEYILKEDKYRSTLDTYLEHTQEER